MNEADLEERKGRDSPDLYRDNVRGRGFQNFNPEDAILPRVRLNGKTGFFEFNLEDEDKKSAKLVIVPIFMAKSRIYFDPDQESSDVFCRSANGDAPTWIQPGLWKDDTPPKVCLACQYAKWGNKQGERQPPACTLHWNFLAVQPNELGTPFIFSVRGTSLSAASRMMTMLNRSAKDLFSAEVSLGSIEAGEGKRKYFKLVFEAHHLLEDAEMLPCEEIYEAYVGDNPTMITQIMGGARFAGNTSSEPAGKDDEEVPAKEDDDEVPF